MRTVVLIGPPGAGKTAVGEELARMLGRGFLDTDQMVEAATGMSVSQIFVERGEAAFRDLERSQVARALELGRSEELVVALGGGAPMDPATQAALGDGPDAPLVVFLDVSAAEAAKRVGLGAARPLLQGSPRKMWRDLMARRRPVYEGLAGLTVLTDGTDPLEAAGQIALHLGEGRT
jgi:shikimate kinase